MQESTLVLPSEVVSPMDIARILRELENLDEFFRQAQIRQGGQPQAAPRYSRLLDSIVVANGVNLLEESGREKMLDLITKLKNRAPVLHMSFSVDPPGPYVQKIVSWLRDNIDPNVLVRVGLQPNIGAGCVVRTTNKSYDFSLRRFFDDKKEFFAAKLHEAVSEDPTAVTVATNEDTVVTNSGVVELPVPPTLKLTPEALLKTEKTEPSAPAKIKINVEEPAPVESAQENNEVSSVETNSDNVVVQAPAETRQEVSS